MPKSQEEQYLDILSIFHYVVGGLLYFCGLFPIFHFVMGIFFIFTAVTKGDEESLMLGFMGMFFALFSMVFMISAWTIATLTLLSGRNLARRTRYRFCLIMAGVVCIFMPFGTVLGVFTILVLCKPQVKSLFGIELSAVSE